MYRFRWGMDDEWYRRDLPESHDQIIEAISWIEPALMRSIEENGFPEIYNAGPSVLLSKS